MPQSSTFWIIMISAYMLFTLGLGWVVSKVEEKKNKDSSLLHTELSWPVLLMTYTASMMSTFAFLAGPGVFYRNGIAHWLEEMSYFVLFLIICQIVMNRVWLASQGEKFETPSDFFDFRYKSPALRVILGIIFLSASFPYIASVLASIARAVVQISGGEISYAATVWIVGIIMVIFTVIGGMKAVAWSDTIQGVMYIGMIWFIFIACLKVGFNGSLSAAFASVWEHTQTTWFSMPGPSRAVTYEFRFGKSLCTAIGYTVMQPHVFIRAGFASKNIETQRKLSYLGPMLQVIVWTGVMLIGLVGVGLLPGLTGGETELIIPLLIEDVILNINPALAGALTLAFFFGIMGVGISTANSFLLVAGAIVYKDFFTKILKVENNPAKERKYTQATILIVGLIGVILGLNPPQLMYTLILFSIAIVMPVFPILLYGMFWKRATKEAAIVSAIVGTILVLMTYFVWNIGDTWYGILGMVAAVVLMPIVSFMTPDRSSDSDEMIDNYNTNFKKVFGTAVEAQ